MSRFLLATIHLYGGQVKRNKNGIRERHFCFVLFFCLTFDLRLIPAFTDPWSGIRCAAVIPQGRNVIFVRCTFVAFYF